MSKELEAFEEIKRIYNWFQILVNGKQLDKEDIRLLNVVETALEDYEVLKKLNENQKHTIELFREENRTMKNELKQLYDSLKGILKDE